MKMRKRHARKKFSYRVILCCPNSRDKSMLKQVQNWAIEK